jgi:hypothetical protein
MRATWKCASTGGCSKQHEQWKMQEEVLFTVTHHIRAQCSCKPGNSMPMHRAHRVTLLSTISIPCLQTLCPAAVPHCLQPTDSHSTQLSFHFRCSSCGVTCPVVRHTVTRQIQTSLGAPLGTPRAAHSFICLMIHSVIHTSVGAPLGTQTCLNAAADALSAAHLQCDMPSSLHNHLPR